MKPYILAIDPGLLTGICLMRSDPIELLWSDEVDWINTARLTDQTLRELGGVNVDVVIERYTITSATAKKTQQTWSLELIGITRFLCLVHSAGDMTLQSPADAKNFASNARLKSIGLWHVGGAGHALDAIRHGLLFAARNGLKDSRLLHS